MAALYAVVSLALAWAPPSMGLVLHRPRPPRLLKAASAVPSRIGATGESHADTADMAPSCAALAASLEDAANFKVVENELDGRVERTVFTARRAKQGDVLIRVPRSRIISTARVRLSNSTLPNGPPIASQALFWAAHCDKPARICSLVRKNLQNLY